ncbi:hypothetical protein ONZ45_g8042 [Pleurotus djamor]|nr:hypothetical protein ONZ45_g8042 [Pleurotus djamor]
MHIEVTVQVEEVLKDGIPIETTAQYNCEIAHAHSSLENSNNSNNRDGEGDDLTRSRLVYLKLQRLDVKDIDEEEEEEPTDEENGEDAWGSAVSELLSSDEELGWSSAASHCSDSEDEDSN